VLQSPTSTKRRELSTQARANCDSVCELFVKLNCIFCSTHMHSCRVARFFSFWQTLILLHGLEPVVVIRASWNSFSCRKWNSKQNSFTSAEISTSLKRSRSLAYTATTSVRRSFLVKADSLKALTFRENPDSFGCYKCSPPPRSVKSTECRRYSRVSCGCSFSPTVPRSCASCEFRSSGLFW
jgi:hypothetical protein